MARRRIIRQQILRELKEDFLSLSPQVDFCSLRFVRQKDEILSVRQDVLQPVSVSEDQGAMITVIQGKGMGYAATSDLSKAGLSRAVEKARQWADQSAASSAVDYEKVPMDIPDGDFESAVDKPWSSVPIKEKIELLMSQSRSLHPDPRIVDWRSFLWHTDQETMILGSRGGQIRQHRQMLLPELRVVANEGTETQTRSFGGMRGGQLGGLEVLDRTGFHDAASRLVREALELLAAPQCPSGRTELLLGPDQMILQIHESIGHPLELDRILGDERNFAGTSFVTQEMFGSYRYGSDLLNITFDPGIPYQLASYDFDDEGRKAERTMLIEKGILQRPLGGGTSQARAGMPGVSNSRASSWNRPPIDRMANLNLEPGDSTFDQLVEAVENGIYMQSNCSWSIDDSRNKFQFGCEYGRRIKDGRLDEVVKNPNYRGISANFWRNLRMLGNRETLQVLGTPNCGKGEPNQIIKVGHASPAALFHDVDVFGGA